MLQRHFLPRPPRCPRGADHKLAEGRRACRRKILSEGARLTGGRRSGGCRSRSARLAESHRQGCWEVTAEGGATSVNTQQMPCSATVPPV